MQAVAQHHSTHAPSLRVALTAMFVAAVVVAFGVSAMGSRQTVPQNDVQADSSRLPENSSRRVATDATTKNARLWPSDVMDAHDSVPSLAALTKTPGSSAKPL